MEVYCTRSGCPRPKKLFWGFRRIARRRRRCSKSTACGMPLILVGTLSAPKAARRGFEQRFLARDRYTPGMRQCAVKQFQPSGNLTLTSVELAHKLFECEAEVLEEIGSQHDQIPCLLSLR